MIFVKSRNFVIFALLAKIALFAKKCTFAKSVVFRLLQTVTDLFGTVDPPERGA